MTPTQDTTGVRAALLASRAARGWTQARAAAELGVSLTHYSMTEREPRLMTPRMAQRISQLFGIAVAELLAEVRS